MKFRTLATATSTLLGAALMGYGQTQTDRQQDQTTGRPAAQQPGETASPGTTRERGQTEATERARDSTARQSEQPDDQRRTQPGARQQREMREQPGSQDQGQAQRQDQPQGQAQDRRTSDINALREMSWDDAEESQLQLYELPDRARKTLQTVSVGAQIEEEVTQLSKDGHQVYRATLTREGDENLHIFLQEDGSVVHTKQSVELNQTPESVRNAIRQELDGQPQEVHRLIVDGETYYAASMGQGQQARTVRFDEQGNMQREGARAQARQAGQPGSVRDTTAAGRPGQREASPGQREMTPGQRQRVPEQRETTPGQRETSPEQREISPEQREISPGQREIERETSPGQRQSAPEQSETSPGQRQTAPGQRDN